MNCNQVRELLPDLVILDITMPVLDGFSAAREIHKALPNVAILLLSMHESPNLINIAKSSGAHVVRFAPTPSEPCIDDRKRYSSDVVLLFTQFGESVTHAIMIPGV